ncbi:hypothetical protein [Sulfolobus acidocaldarius]|uniref:Conserved protein n=4 Tax=Sulfolobus acidocaldarius TaxID=2285 RepID=Q4J7H7_SULAC|nr:hypothetical protein [Sulfolobus acidocaldarius]AAY81255.1 conserved protein [Sulfolobus acidocaldarius DSM 639]AGE71885.1 hypothetical protein SacN8_09640 [Sulfolobus acidocaldarius N8]AGE74158.1 hypothetical protein SacRon12I_09665 [Sulfolobus acidocaldarius Ron12/I]ALU29939.1 VapB-type antitoxin [Sulfolobus acidocaldarius]ALU32683.1 VapB-type antitoxin [Sulfolobus acidocaldarius]
MGTPITIKVSDDIYDLIQRMVKLGIAKTKNEAVNLLIEYGRAEVERMVRLEEEVERLVEKWLNDGFPYKGLSTEDLRKERYE